MTRKVLAAALCWIGPTAGFSAEIQIDAAQSIGAIRPLHGGNCGPLQYGGVLDFSEQFRELGPPLIRLHDCHWPNPDVVDMHVVFPAAEADSREPGSYDFRRTDAYLQAIVNAGSGLVYRLGESIEHETPKYRVHPPKDPERWAAACLGIIRHYNEGWADGFRHNIRYWEIWNEPENRPAMWTGTDEQYFQLYEITAEAIKSRWPDLKVGGPSLGHTGLIRDGRLEPGEFLMKFLAHCRDRNLPLDFFSWHLYTNDPSECVVRGRAIREILDEHGFTATELHLNEWNYLPGNDWGPMMPEGQGKSRAAWFERIRGAEGAAFAACVLMNLQDAPVDVANYYSFTHHGFGAFTTEGVPSRLYFALLAFRRLLECPVRIASRSSVPAQLTALAGVNPEGRELRVLLSTSIGDDKLIRVQVDHLPWTGSSQYELSVVNDSKELEVVRRGVLTGSLDFDEALAAPAVGLLRVMPAE